MSGASGRRGGRVAHRLGLTFGLLTLLIALCGAGTLIGALALESRRDGVSERLRHAEDDNLRLFNAGVSAQRSMRGYLVTGDQSELAAFRAARDGIPSVIDDLRGHEVADEDDLATQQRQLEAYLRIADEQEYATPGSAQAVSLTREATRRFDAFEVTNSSLNDQLNEEEQRQEGHADTVVRAGVAGLGAALVAALAVAVYTSVHTVRALTGPLRSTERTLDRLTAGEHSARAEEDGPEEIRAVARSVNLFADERERLRAVEEERQRLSKAARKTGIRIRGRLDVDYVLDAACSGIGEVLAADYVFILLAENGGSEFPVARVWSAERGLLPDEERRRIPTLPADVVSDHYRRGTVWLATDLPQYLSRTRPIPGAPGSFGKTGMPSGNRAAAAALGLDSAVITPIGVGEEPIGAVSVARTSADRPWRPVDIEIAESMASGVGRALHTALLYEKESGLVDKLRALDKAKSDFLSTVSHELRTPLTSIVGYIELLKDDDAGSLSPSHLHMLDVVDRNANRLRALIEDLLTLSRIESGAFTSRKAPVDLRRLVASAVDAIRPAAEAASVSLETRCPEQPLVLEADGEQLDRVLMNLLSNAVKFTRGGGKVSVRADAQDGEAVLRVSDTGIGIPAAEQEKLFQRFFRASNATEQAIPGTGLGLTIVHTIVANHGGRTAVRSEEGRGTTITAWLPLTGTDGAAGSA
ncbi:ATP-binding protein [Streptomyces sp. ME02-8801-2C]|uniref:ATP-binding protein n=1 Tax=Streptomyces sp. ME02-8801-2C TaxID=3028680 RepID=UPI0029AF2B7C|nr:ATP-binding protein [Streptomyces sp. ME02-8801-2C]MDX3451803.1 ATP-binding protein [Streptomyces sp. ME02-8801-2C]